MAAKAKVAELLKLGGAILVRHRKHKVWKLENGSTFTQSTTPRGHRADDHQARDLRHALGIVTGGQEGQRREKKRRQGRHESIRYEKFNSALSDKLQLCGITEQALKHRIEQLETELTWTRDELTQTQEALSLPKCWWCKLRTWVGK